MNTPTRGICMFPLAQTKRNITKYTLICPTKSGGTVTRDYFNKHYYKHFVFSNKQPCIHRDICTNVNNPILIVRDVKDRFLSMYKYWKNGSEKWKRTNDWKKTHKNTTILDFIRMLKENDKSLITEFTWEQHYHNTSNWIKPGTNYKNIIIVKYEKILEKKIHLLLNNLNIPNKNIPLPVVNKTIPCQDEKAILESEEVNRFIHEYFKKDIEFHKTIETHPELFKMII